MLNTSKSFTESLEYRDLATSLYIFDTSHLVLLFAIQHQPIYPNFLLLQQPHLIHHISLCSTNLHRTYIGLSSCAWFHRSNRAGLSERFASGVERESWIEAVSKVTSIACRGFFHEHMLRLVYSLGSTLIS